MYLLRWPSLTIICHADIQITALGFQAFVKQRKYQIPTNENENASYAL